MNNFSYFICGIFVGFIIIIGFFLFLLKGLLYIRHIRERREQGEQEGRIREERIRNFWQRWYKGRCDKGSCEVDILFEEGNKKPKEPKEPKEPIKSRPVSNAFEELEVN